MKAQIPEKKISKAEPIRPFCLEYADAKVEFRASIIASESNDERMLGLRYDEFIALNTWQIQKLKARVAELETLVAKLQEG